MDSMDRYTTPAASELWSDQYKYQLWANVEVAAARAQGADATVAKAMAAAPVPTPEQVAKEEETTRHDVVAFLNVWRRSMPPEVARCVHWGLTSSDVVDTANALRMAEVADMVANMIDTHLVDCLAGQAIDHRQTVRVGRTHGQTAEVTTWGHRLAEFAFAFERASRRIRLLRPMFAVGKLSGPVGDYKRVSPAAETAAMLRLELDHPQAASQIVMRDGYVDFVFALSQVATVIEALALEVRLSSRSDTREVAEGFGSGQAGSSSMPHKRNPITAEKLCGLARLVRAQVDPVAQGVAVHHERDISHSSVERVALETASKLVVYMVDQCHSMMMNLEVRVDVMRERVVNSPELLTAASKDELISAGVAPEVAWNLINNAWMDYRAGAVSDFATALALGWASITKHGPLPGVAKGWMPDFKAMTDRLAKPERLIGRTSAMYADLGELREW